MNKKLFFILILLPFITNSQVVSDAKLWAGVTLNKKLNDFEFSFSEELRLDENFSHIDKVFSELGAEYKIKKGFYVSLGYRFDRDNDYESGNYDLSNRIDLGLSYKQKFENFNLEIKSKYQTKSSSPEENNPTYWRNKLSFDYKLDNPFTPYASYEFYYQFNDEKVINRTRISIGTKYEINNNNAVKVYYTFENRFNVKNLEHNHIWGLSYSIDL